MLNLLLALSLGILIGWSFHSFFNKLGEPNIIRTDINISMNRAVPTTAPLTLLNAPLIEKKEQNSSQPKIHKTIKKKENVDHFYKLLNRGLFSDAMALYMDAPEKKTKLYRVKLFYYFREQAKSDTALTIVQMHQFIELEPDEHEEIAKLLVETLSSSKNYHELVSFLEEQIARSSSPSFYTYKLAKYYVGVKNYTRAIELLKEIEFDENFGEKAKALLELINKKIDEEKEYAYTIPLKKFGEHFTVNVSLNDTPLTLLLDTGATLTMVNEEKLPLLTILQENITVETAGGEINAQLQEAEKLSVGELELEKFQLVSSSFQQKNADGLLGMNFFKKFKFKIDQESKLLYLSLKK